MTAPSKVEESTANFNYYSTTPAPQEKLLKLLEPQVNFLERLESQEKLLGLTRHFMEISKQVAEKNGVQYPYSQKLKTIKEKENELALLKPFAHIFRQNGSN